jgi:hypothetical protein
MIEKGKEIDWEEGLEGEGSIEEEGIEEIDQKKRRV